jgi:quercetin dioxygenase-like cupin family protein
MAPSTTVPADPLPVERPKAASRLLQENARVIVTEWRLPPGAETGWHRHAHDYVVVCLTAGRLVAETAAGKVETRLEFGQAYTRPAGTEHNIVNPGDAEFAFVEVEIK